MPTPVATAGRGTSKRVDTNRQSISPLRVPEALAPVNCAWTLIPCRFQLNPLESIAMLRPTISGVKLSAAKKSFAIVPPSKR